MSQEHVKIVKLAVLGAGVVRLSTATRITQCLPNVDITVIADKFTKDTTSHGAAGMILPSYRADPDTVTSRKRLRQWMETSFQYYRDLVTGPEAGVAGGSIQTGLILTKRPYEDPLYKDIVFSFRQLSDTELEKLNIDGAYKFRSRGGNIVKGKIQDLSELVGVYDVVINCTGLGSRQLISDTKLHPVRGHLIWLIEFIDAFSKARMLAFGGRAWWSKQENPEKTFNYPVT